MPTVKDAPMDAGRMNIQESILKRFRAGFPILENGAYLATCERSVIHQHVRTSITDFIDDGAHARNFVDDHGVYDTACSKFAQLVSSDRECITAVANVSMGIYSIIDAVAATQGKNIVICAEVEHSNIALSMLHLKDKGVSIRNIRALPSGGLDVKALLDAIDPNTVIVSCPSVSCVTGERMPLERIGGYCDDRDILFVVDGAQSAGVLAHDLGAEKVGAFVAPASKYLLGLHGFGFLYVSPAWAGRLDPPYRSQAGVVAPENVIDLEDEYPVRDGADKFRIGGINRIGAVAVNAGLDLLLDLGGSAIEERTVSLASKLRDAAIGKSLSPFVCEAGSAASHIVSIPIDDPNGNQSVSGDMQLLLDRLDAAGVRYSANFNKLRFGFHAFNNDADVECAVRALAASGAVA